MKHLKLLALFLIVGIVAISSICYVFNQKQDINQLTDNQLRSELVSIKGMGPVLTERVVAYRQEHKPITLGELDLIKGIGDKRLSLIKKKFKE